MLLGNRIQKAFSLIIRNNLNDPIKTFHCWPQVRVLKPWLWHPAEQVTMHFPDSTSQSCSETDDKALEKFDTTCRNCRNLINLQKLDGLTGNTTQLTTYSMLLGNWIQKAFSLILHNTLNDPIKTFHCRPKSGLKPWLRHPAEQMTMHFPDSTSQSYSETDDKALENVTICSLE